MRDGIQAVLAAGYRNLLVEGDNKVVIQVIQGHIHIPWQIQTLLSDIHNMIHLSVHCLFQHTYREGDMAADMAALFVRRRFFLFPSLLVGNFFLFLLMTI